VLLRRYRKGRHTEFSLVMFSAVTLAKKSPGLHKGNVYWIVDDFDVPLPMRFGWEKHETTDQHR
jgi:hypothetical protein